MRLLNLELAKELKAGDVITYTFDTTLNGTKNETVLFLELTETDFNKYNATKDEVLLVPALRIRIIDAPGDLYSENVDMITIPADIDDKENFRIWTNGYNKVYVTHINGIQIKSDEIVTQ